MIHCRYSGKCSYPTEAAALAEWHTRSRRRGQWVGWVYQCRACHLWHICRGGVRGRSRRRTWSRRRQSR